MNACPSVPHTGGSTTGCNHETEGEVMDNIGFAKRLINPPAESASLGTMIIHRNPEGLFASPQFSQAVEIPAGARLLFVGGQNGVDETGRLVGPDAASQTKRALQNVRTAVEGSGGSFADVAKFTILTTSRDHIEAGAAAFLEVWGTENPPPAITVAIISDLGPEGALVEVDAVAALPA
jgi:enamine deaminase RidA (YjgF/YER057c/UK114 family)